MKKSTALAAIAASAFAIGAHAEQDHKVTTSVAEAHEQQSAQSIVDDLGIVRHLSTYRYLRWFSGEVGGAPS